MTAITGFFVVEMVLRIVVLGPVRPAPQERICSVVFTVSAGKDGTAQHRRLHEPHGSHGDRYDSVLILVHADDHAANNVQPPRYIVRMKRPKAPQLQIFHPGTL